MFKNVRDRRAPARTLVKIKGAGGYAERGAQERHKQVLLREKREQKEQGAQGTT